MKPALAYRQPQAPKSWQDLPHGETIISAINRELQPWWQKFFGYHLLKVGALSAAVDTHNSTIKHQFSTSAIEGKGSVIADIDDLPFLQHSIDVCILSHTLEFSLDPHHVIREANRVLIPDGHLVITGFNPFSLVGINQLIPYRKNKSPWREHFFSPMRIKDWLNLMGYEVLSDKRCLFSNLYGKSHSGPVATSMHAFFEKYLNAFGSVYVIIAKKRTLPLSPIKPKWQMRAKFRPINVPSMKVHKKVD
ncbi:MAG: class I SAM-dependent methyltransferase [Colwellia sp.]